MTTGELLDMLSFFGILAQSAIPSTMITLNLEDFFVQRHRWRIFWTILILGIVAMVGAPSWVFYALILGAGVPPFLVSSDHIIYMTLNGE